VRPATILRAVLLAVLTVLGVLHLADAEFWSPFSGLIFGTHEFGHLVFTAFGEWIGVAGGSAMQLLLPVVAAVYFHRAQKDRFAVAVCGAWLAVSLANLAVYIGDARAELLDLVSFSPDGGVHDWNYLLESVGLLRRDTSLARFTRLLGWLTLGGSLLLGVRVIRGGPAGDGTPAPAHP